MKQQKTQLSQTLLNLCSFIVMAALLIGCHPAYITQEIFIEELCNAYGIEDSSLVEAQINYVPEENITRDEAITLIEYLNDQVFDSTISSKYLTKSQAKEMINDALNIYLEKESEGKEEIDLKEYIELVKYTKVEDHHYKSEQEVNEGDLILVDGIMQRVIKVEGEDLYTEDVDFEEAVDSINIDEESEVTAEDIELEDGVSYLNTNMSNKGLNLSLKVNFTKDIVSLLSDVSDFLNIGNELTIGTETSYKDGSLSLIPTNDNYGSNIYTNYQWISQYRNGTISLSQLKKKMKMKEEKEADLFEAKYSSGYSITGTVELSNITVHPSIQYDSTGLHRLSIGLNYDLKCELKYKGKMEESIKLARMKIPVGQTGMKVDVDLYLNFTGNGEVSLTMKHSDHTKVEYNEGLIKKVNAESTSLIVDAALKLHVGPSLDIGIDYLGMKIIDLDLGVNAELKPYTSLSLNTEIDENEIYLNTHFKYGVNGYLPIITLKMGTKSSLAYRCGLSFTCKLKDEEHTNKYKLYENDQLLYENHIPLLEEKNDLDGNLDLSSYYLYMPLNTTTSISITSMPEGYELSDLIYEVDDPTIVALSNTTFTALKEGVTTYHIYTSDHQYESRCVIQVVSEKEIT